MSNEKEPPKLSKILEIKANWMIEDYDRRLPVTVIAGFDSSGKSRLIQQIIESRKDLRFFAFQADECDDIPYDSLECAATNSFYDAIYRILQTRNDIDHLLIEIDCFTSSIYRVAANILVTNLKDLMRLASIFMMIDFATFDPELWQQLNFRSFGDIILLSNTDLVDNAKLSSLNHEMSKVARVVHCPDDEFPLPVISELGVLQSETGQTPIVLEPGLELLEIENYLVTGDRLSLIWFESNFAFALTKFQEWLDSQASGTVFRVEGVLWFTESPKCHPFYLSGKRIVLDEAEWNQAPKNQIFLVGQNMNAKKLYEQLSNCLNQV